MSTTVIYRDRTYTEEEATQISMMRAERWGLLLMYNELQQIEHREAFDKRNHVWRRIERLNFKLFQLTKNPIYNP